MKAGMPPSPLRVQDVMTRDVIFVDKAQTLEQAWEVLHARGVSGAPVIGDHDRVVGIVTKADLADPRRRWPVTAGIVENAMTRVVYAVRPEDPVMSAVRLMLEEDVHRVVAVAADGTVAGILAPMDILRALLCGEDMRAPLPSNPSVQYVDVRTARRRSGDRPNG